MGTKTEKKKEPKERTFVVLQGDHTDADGTIHKEGSKIKSIARLDRVFPNKFKIYHPHEDSEDDDSKNLKNNVEIEGPDRGEDVTDKFDTAEEEGLEVFFKDEEFSIFKKGDYEEPLKTTSSFKKAEKYVANF